jgi:hypothetical protein
MMTKPFRFRTCFLSPLRAGLLATTLALTLLQGVAHAQKKSNPEFFSRYPNPVTVQKGSPGSYDNDDLYRWCDDSVTTLSRAQNLARSYFGLGRYQDAIRTVQNALRTVEFGGHRFSPRDAITSRYAGRLRYASEVAMSQPAKNADYQAKTIAYFLDESVDSLRSLTRDLRKHYHDRDADADDDKGDADDHKKDKKHCGSCGHHSRDRVIDRMVVKLVKSQLKIADDTLIGERNDSSVYPIGDDRTYLKVMELMLAASAWDLSSTLDRYDYSCLIPQMIDLADDLHQHLAGSDSRFLDRYDAFSVTHREVAEYLSEIGDEPNNCR